MLTLEIITLIGESASLSLPGWEMKRFKDGFTEGFIHSALCYHLAVKCHTFLHFFPPRATPLLLLLYAEVLPLSHNLFFFPALAAWLSGWVVVVASFKSVSCLCIGRGVQKLIYYPDLYQNYVYLYD